MSETHRTTETSLLSRFVETSLTDTHPSMTLGDGPALRLTMRHLKGTSYSFSYASLVRIQFRPDDGISLEFACGTTFSIRGLCLEQLFGALTRQEVLEIQQVASDRNDFPNECVSVFAIEME